ncbi:hypothetical protein B0J17DRAFT_439440 [Rhizoctonia solani]|nr:hypothetical protein B0J17DRAFT_439440 [Rhizoctonia solani]
MQNLRAIVELVQYPKAYLSLARPSVIGGCIKLLSGVKLGDRFSPFSYEYGFLCFRVLTIVLGMCILHRSNRLENFIQAMGMDARTNPRLEILQLFGHYFSTSLSLEISGGSRTLRDEGHFDWIFGVIKVEGRPNLHPLVRISDIKLLSDILWDDRYNLIATADQKHATEYMNMFVSAGKSLLIWEGRTRQIDLEDCREVIGAYIDRLEPRNPLLYEPITVLDGPILLRALVQFVAPGTEDLLPRILESNVKRIWDEIKAPLEPHKPDVYVDAIRDTLTNYATILQNRVFFAGRTTVYFKNWWGLS